ncbi:MAG: 4-hydroxy-tetrahydrodipicolinate reductase [Phycisphaerae bacterium]
MDLKQTMDKRISKQPVELAICGALGRMGSRISALAAESPDRFRIVAAIDRPPAHAAPTPVHIATALPAGVDVLIDFSAPAATRAMIASCVEHKTAMVIGTTGLTAADHTLIDAAAKSIPILQAANTSLGVNVLLALVAQTARQLGEAYDIEIVEAHHKEKKDSPSGTALSLAEAICSATGRTITETLVHGRHGANIPRQPGTIGMHAVRMGDVVGEHTVYFATSGERIELKHTASTRDTFARGALRAAEFIAGQKPGRYTMRDVLGLASLC